MDSVRFDDSQLQDFQKKLIQIGIEKFPDEIKKFLKENATILKKNALKSAKHQTKKKTGNYYKGFKVSRAFVGQKRGFIKTYNSQFHSHLIEYGHEKWIRGIDTGTKTKGKYILTLAASKFVTQYLINAEKFLREYFDKNL